MKDTICVAVGLAGGFLLPCSAVGIPQLSRCLCLWQWIFDWNCNRCRWQIQTLRERKALFHGRLVRTSKEILHTAADYCFCPDGHFAWHDLHSRCCLHQFLFERTIIYR